MHKHKWLNNINTLTSKGAVISHRIKSTLQEAWCIKCLLSTTVVILIVCDLWVFLPLGFISAIVKMVDDDDIRWLFRMEKHDLRIYKQEIATELHTLSSFNECRSCLIELLSHLSRCLSVGIWCNEIKAQEELLARAYFSWAGPDGSLQMRTNHGQPRHTGGVSSPQV